jgi:Domain of unknown function (DUF4157)
MFAPKVAKPQTAATVYSAHRPAPQSSTLLARRASNLTWDNPGDCRRNASLGDTPARDASRGPSWDFAGIPLFPPDQASRDQSLSVRSAQPQVIQPKLEIGPVDDPLEREADAIADQLMRMPDPAQSRANATMQRKCVSCEEAEQSAVRAKQYGVHGAPSHCPQCGEAKAGPPMQGMSGNRAHSGYDFSRISSANAARDTAGSADNQEQDAEGEPDLSGAGQASAVAGNLSLGAGSPLPASERSFMEPRFGHSFADVRVHTDSRANDVAASVGARAFARGNDIVFGKGEGSSGTDRRLLAHELTHVVQQRGGDRSGTISPADPNVVRRYLVGPPQQVGLTNTTPATYGECRNFNTVDTWNTGLRSGFIVQECIYGDSITRCADGANVPAGNVPHFWEAWEVDAAGTISDGNADTWFRGGRPGTSGWWTIDSNVFAHSGALDPAWGFARGGVVNAGSLLATTTGPSRDQLYQPSTTRHHGGTWDCCGATKTHVPR